MAWEVIRTATAMLDAVAGGIEPVGIADPEPWTIKRANARKILAAIDNGDPVDPRWLEAIGRAAVGQAQDGASPPAHTRAREASESH